MKILIIGFGSIGKRHARVLQKTLKIPSASIFIRDLISSRREEALNQGFNIDDGDLSYDIVVLAASTASHIQILKDIPIPKTSI